jgi:hypothetical protein
MAARALDVVSPRTYTKARARALIIHVRADTRSGKKGVLPFLQLCTIARCQGGRRPRGLAVVNMHNGCVIRD